MSIRRGYIYGIYCYETNSIYVGQSVDIQSRWNTHKNQLKKGIHPNYKLQEEYNKLGPDEFDYIKLKYIPEPILDKYEEIYIEAYGRILNLYNIDLDNSVKKKYIEDNFDVEEY